jgi:pimeloyl-ACP methyl ester carboxylesterase
MKTCNLMVAYAYAARYPNDVKHLALLEAPIPDESVYIYSALTANGPGLWCSDFLAHRRCLKNFYRAMNLTF